MKDRGMSINIDSLTEKELIDLNHRVVERLRFLQHARTHVAMLQFRIGERVSFHPEGHPHLYGIVTRYNKKSVTVVTDAGAKWTVAPQLLRSEERQAPQSPEPTTPSTILQLPKA
jgi:hypothetical protein